MTLSDSQRDTALREALERKIDSMDIRLTPEEEQEALDAAQANQDQWQAGIDAQAAARAAAGPEHPQGTEKLSPDSYGEDVVK